MNTQYPKILISDALAKTDGNQAELGRLLGYQRASVHQWTKSEDIYLPELAAWRFSALFMKQEAVDDEQAA